MSYLHVELLLAPLLAAALAHLGQRRGLDVKHWGYGLGVLCVIASIWTTPWDNWMVATGVWGYPPSAVLGTIWHIPVEEQAFFVVQTLMTGAWFGLLIDPTRPSAPRSAAARACAALGALGMVAAGVFAFREGHTYLGSMLAWFGVPLAVQFAWGADQLGRHVHAIVPGIALPTIVLCVSSPLAVQQGMVLRRGARRDPDRRAAARRGRLLCPHEHARRRRARALDEAARELGVSARDQACGRRRAGCLAFFALPGVGPTSSRSPSRFRRPARGPRRPQPAGPPWSPTCSSRPSSPRVVGGARPRSRSSSP